MLKDSFQAIGTLKSKSSSRFLVAQVPNIVNKIFTATLGS